MRNQDFKKIGEHLKQKRTELNLTLKEAENATSIRLNHLQAIEDGEMSKLISPVYAQGFIRQYASFLGMDGEKILREHPELFSGARMNSSEDFSYGIGTIEMRNSPGSNVKWLPNVAWAIAFAGILGIVWYLAKFLEVL